MHYYVGIDIAKSFHVACVVDQNDKVIKKSLKFNNDESGFDELLLLLNSIDEVSNFTIAMEATGIFFENLYLYLSQKGFNVT